MDVGAFTYSGAADWAENTGTATSAQPRRVEPAEGLSGAPSRSPSNVQRKPPASLSQRAQAIFGEIKANPGITATQLVAIVGGAWGSIQYHLSNLVGKKRVEKIRIGRQAHFYVRGVERESVICLVLARQPQNRRIIELLRHQSSLRLGDVCRNLGMTRKTVLKNLRDLAKAGLVEAKAGTRPRYSLIAPPPASGAD